MAARIFEPNPKFFQRQIHCGEHFWFHFGRSQRAKEVHPNVVRYPAMRRIQAILVVVALLATPLALLARGRADDAGECDRLCCLRHGSHPGGANSATDGMMCHRGTMRHQCVCNMRPGPQSPDYGLLAPIGPTTPSPVVTILSPEIFRAEYSLSNEATFSGFTPSPFEPPRA